MRNEAFLGQSELRPQGDPVELGEASASVLGWWAAPSPHLLILKEMLDPLALQMLSVTKAGPLNKVDIHQAQRPHFTTSSGLVELSPLNEEAFKKS